MENTKRLAMLVVGLAMIASLAMVGCAKKATEVSVSKLQRIHFDYDQYNVKPEYKGVMKDNAKWMKVKGKSVVIEGHCDERGAAEYNIALGDRRAKSSKTYLSNLGSDAKKISTISYGEERPLSNCHTESCWSQNRRTEFVGK